MSREKLQTELRKKDQSEKKEAMRIKEQEKFALLLTGRVPDANPQISSGKAAAAAATAAATATTRRHRRHRHRHRCHRHRHRCHRC